MGIGGLNEIAAPDDLTRQAINLAICTGVVRAQTLRIGPVLGL